MIKKYLLRILFASILIPIFCLPSYALKKETHADINEHIAANNFNRFSLNRYLIDQLGLQNGASTIINSNYIWAWLRTGGRMEDASLSRSANHFHNPLTDAGFSGIWGTGFYSGKSSIAWSQLPVGEQALSQIPESMQPTYILDSLND